MIANLRMRRARDLLCGRSLPVIFLKRQLKKREIAQHEIRVNVEILMKIACVQKTPLC